MGGSSLLLRQSQLPLQVFHYHLVFVSVHCLRWMVSHLDQDHHSVRLVRPIHSVHSVRSIRSTPSARRYASSRFSRFRRFPRLCSSVRAWLRGLVSVFFLFFHSQFFMFLFALVPLPIPLRLFPSLFSSLVVFVIVFVVVS